MLVFVIRHTENALGILRGAIFIDRRKRAPHLCYYAVKSENFQILMLLEREFLRPEE